jgi:hypothetical protein
MPVSRRRRRGTGPAAEQKVLIRPAPEHVGRFVRARLIGDFVMLDWHTAYGTIGLAHSLKSADASARWLADAVYGQFWDHMHEVYAALVVSQAGTNLDGAPGLAAIDLHPDCRLSDSYEVTWRQLTAVVGTPAPWFHWALRDKDAISAWKAGDPPAIVPANDVELPTQALIELAADEPDGSPAAAVCLWLARHLRRRDANAAQQEIGEIRAAAADPGNDCAYVHIAAVPAPILRPEDPELDETGPAGRMGADRRTARCARRSRCQRRAALGRWESLTRGSNRPVRSSFLLGCCRVDSALEPLPSRAAADSFGTTAYGTHY